MSEESNSSENTDGYSGGESGGRQNRFLCRHVSFSNNGLFVLGIDGSSPDDETDDPDILGLEESSGLLLMQQMEARLLFSFPI